VRTEEGELVTGEVHDIDHAAKRAIELVDARERLRSHAST
jgi:hypothetical protein